ncbi:N-acetyltransferase [Candidatus Margulisiibacteriota bacterium]
MGSIFCYTFSAMIRKAKITDVKEIQTIVNNYASQELMLPRSLNNLYDNLRDFYVVESGGKVRGCVALHIVWEDMAEIKALAVEEDLKGKGWGKKLVQECMKEAKGMGVKKVFALTLIKEFFHKQGFKSIQKRQLPRKIWNECIHCMKFADGCNEIAVAYEFNGGEPGGKEEKK